MKSMLAGGAPLLPTFPNSLIASVMTSLSFSFSISARISSPSNMLHRVQRVTHRFINRTECRGPSAQSAESHTQNDKHPRRQHSRQGKGGRTPPRPDLQATAGSAERLGAQAGHPALPPVRQVVPRGAHCPSAVHTLKAWTANCAPECLTGQRQSSDCSRDAQE